MQILKEINQELGTNSSLKIDFFFFSHILKYKMKLFVETNPKKENFSFLTPHSGISKMKAHQYFVFMEYFYVLLILIYNSIRKILFSERVLF